jgi:hypothetical protein
MNSIEDMDENVSASGRPALTSDEVDQLETYRRAVFAEDHIPLAIGGLLEDNLRIRAFSIAHIRNKLGWDAPDCDWQEDDAESRAASIAQDFITRLRADAEWASLIL